MDVSQGVLVQGAMTYVVRYSRHIDWKRFRMLPVADKKRFQKAVEDKLTVDPLTFGKPMRKSLYGCRSLRVGDFRIIYRVQKNVVEILVFGHRSTVYDDADRYLS